MHANFKLGHTELPDWSTEPQVATAAKIAVLTKRNDRSNSTRGLD